MSFRERKAKERLIGACKGELLVNKSIPRAEGTKCTKEVWI